MAVPRFLRVWKKNPDHPDHKQPTLASIRVDLYLTGSVAPVRSVAIEHRAAYRDTLARLAIAAHRSGYGPAGKRGRVYVSSSYRSRAEQVKLRNDYLAGRGPLAAKPGTSMHERGLAVDVPNVRDIKPLIDECRKLGLRDDVASEKWHLTNHAHTRNDR
jgi:hypothetical protein